MIRPQHRLSLLALLLFLAVATPYTMIGCQTLGLPGPQTFNQKMAYAVGAHTVILQSATAAVRAGALSSSDAEAVARQADDAKLVLDAAQAANKIGDITGADHKLAMALVVLNALQTYMNAHGGSAK